MTLIKCNECGKELSNMAKFCPNCGSAVVKKNKCRECGIEVSIDTVRCPNCGYKMKLAPKNKRILIIFLIVFLIIGLTLSLKNSEAKNVSGEWYNVTRAKYTGGMDTYYFLTLNKDKTCEYSFTGYFEGKTVLPYSTDCKWKINGKRITLYYKDDNKKFAEFTYDKSNDKMTEYNIDTDKEERTYKRRSGK